MLTNVADQTELLRTGTDLKVALGRVTRRLRQGYSPGELTLSETSVLARLVREGPASPGALAEQERVKPQAMGTTLAGLVERGLVQRRPDDADGRRVLMSASPTGVELLTDQHSRNVQRLATALESFTDKERETLAAVVPLLERLADAL